jgi:Family of unknown function (DUF6452)
VRIVQFIVLFFFLTGCLNEPDCIITSTNLVKINFKKDSKTAREITFDKINVSGLTKDFYAGQKVISVQLPVDPEATESTFTFYFEGRTDTIHLSYSKQSEVISATCGAFTNYSGLTVSESSFELFKITNTQLLINASSNIEIFVE